MGKEVTIEITGVNESRDTWFNDCFGVKFQATSHRGGRLFYLTYDSLKKVRELTGFNYLSCTVYVKYATPEGEEEKEDDLNTFPLVPRHIKFLTEVRVFKVDKDIKAHNRKGDVLKTILSKGDVYVEKHDKPNVIVKIENNRIVEEINIKDINKSSLLLPAMSCEETIDAKESGYFLVTKKQLEKKYRARMKKLEQIETEISHIEHLLDIDHPESHD